MKLGKAISITICVLMPQIFSAQLVIDNAINATAAVQNVLLGAGVTANNITFQGNNAQIAGFDCNGCGLGIGSGVVIGSGNADGAAGPNDEGGFSMGPPNGTDFVGDVDLAQLSGQDLHNTATLEFDFVPTGDSLAFNYVFSSEEYPEFVNQNFNDAFAFFLSGPGINGPFSNNAINIALIPGTTVPISINTVNDSEYSGYYQDNTFNTANVQADAFTTVLTAFAEVACGETYHIKIVIGDGFDDLWDSWVYLEEGSFQSNVLSLDYSPPGYAVPADGGIYEGCQPGNLTFTRSGSSEVEQVFDLSFSGTAIIGTDVDFPYTDIVFPPDVNEVVLEFQAIQDFVLEGMELLSITLENLGCGSANATLDIGIYDLPELSVDIDDVLINCGEPAVLSPVISGGLGDYEVNWSDGFVGEVHTVFPSEASTYSFTVTDTCGVVPVDDQVDVSFIVNAPMTVDIGGDITATCLDVFDFVPSVAGGYGAYSYAWYVNGLLESVNSNFIFMSGQTDVIELVVEDDCGVEASDELNFVVPAVPVNFDLGSDWEVGCIDQVTIQPEVTGGVGSYSYNWMVDGVTVAGSTTFDDFFQNDAEVSLMVEDECGNSSLDDVTVVVPPVSILVNLGSDIVTDCLTPNTFMPVVEGGSGNLSYTWFAAETEFSNTTEVTYLADEDTPLALLVEDECGNTGSDAVQISVPPVPVLLTVSSDTIVCLNDEVNLLARVSGGIGDLVVSWEGASNNLAATFVPQNSTQYVCSAFDECGNAASASVAVITESVQPNFNSFYIDDETVGFTNLLADSVMCFWEFSDGTVSNERNPQHRFRTVDEWIATLHAYSVNGCHTELSQTFQPTGEIFVPNAITPNADGINDFFLPVGRDIIGYHLRIFNRFGEMVFESRDMSQPWDGSYKGGEYFVQNGVYPYVLRVTDARYNSFERTGYIELIR